MSGLRRRRLDSRPGYVLSVRQPPCYYAQHCSAAGPFGNCTGFFRAGDRKMAKSPGLGNLSTPALGVEESQGAVGPG